MNAKYELILATGSSRRHSLMDQLNLEYGVRVSNIDESTLEGETPEEYVCRMACCKASAVLQNVVLESSRVVDKASSSVQAILAADTIIELDGQILGKPNDIQDARNTLQKLSAVEHEVLTALCLIYRNDDYKSLIRTKVRFKLLSNEEIEVYCLSNEPYDKAGAYAIQGSAASFVEYISGSYTNVVGLPLLATYKLLKEANILINLQQKRQQ